MVTNSAINTGKPIETTKGGTTVASFTTYGPVVADSSGTGALTAVSPSATSGVPLISQGSAANPAFGTAVVASGGTGITTTTAYGLLAAGTTSTGAFQNVGTGTSGQVLKSNGAALPTWVAASASGNLVLLQTQTASNSASINFTSQISATYTTYLLMMSNVVPVTNAAYLSMLVSSDNGSTYLATGYIQGENYTAYNSAGTWSNANSTTFLYAIQATPNAAPGAVGYMWMYNVGNGNQFLEQGFNISGTGGSTFAISQGVNTSTGVNAFQLTMSSGNISTGTFSLYGLLE